MLLSTLGRNIESLGKHERENSPMGVYDPTGRCKCIPKASVEIVDYAESVYLHGQPRLGQQKGYKYEYDYEANGDPNEDDKKGENSKVTYRDSAYFGKSRAKNADEVWVDI